MYRRGKGGLTISYGSLLDVPAGTVARRVGHDGNLVVGRNGDVAQGLGARRALCAGRGDVGEGIAEGSRPFTGPLSAEVGQEGETRRLPLIGVVVCGPDKVASSRQAGRTA